MAPNSSASRSLPASRRWHYPHGLELRDIPIFSGVAVIGFGLYFVLMAIRLPSQEGWHALVPLGWLKRRRLSRRKIAIQITHDVLSTAVIIAAALASGLPAIAYLGFAGAVLAFAIWVAMIFGIVALTQHVFPKPPYTAYPCPVCGYDVRETLWRCPECGTELQWGQLPEDRRR